jgi:hypothetical protein
MAVVGLTRGGVMDRAEWVARCAGRYLEILVLEEAEAGELAEANAGVQVEECGPDVEGWADPVEAANEDMAFVVAEGEE